MDKQLLHSENNFIKEHLKLNKMLLSTGEIDESIIKLYYVEERIGKFLLILYFFIVIIYFFFNRCWFN